MSTETCRDLRILICEDEIVLAMDLAQLAEASGGTVVGMVNSVSDLHQALQDPGFAADVAFLDVQLIDGKTYEAAEQFQRRGIAVIFCTGHLPADRPETLSHLPWLAKPFRAEDVGMAVKSALALTRPG